MLNFIQIYIKLSIYQNKKALKLRLITIIGLLYDRHNIFHTLIIVKLLIAPVKLHNKKHTDYQ